MELTVFTDGASRGNPGPASYGFVVIKNGEIIHKQGKYIGITTNNVAEYTAVLESLKWVKDNLKEISKIQYLLDSKLVVEQLSGRFKIKSQHLKPIIEQVKSLILEIGEINFTHVPRSKNTVADKLANQALDKI